LTTGFPEREITSMPPPAASSPSPPPAILLAAQRFYTDQLGLTLVEANPGAVVLDSDGVQLRVTLVADKAEAPYTVLGWDVDDLTAAVAALRGSRGHLQPLSGMDQDSDDAWTAPDARRSPGSATPTATSCRCPDTRADDRRPHVRPRQDQHPARSSAGRSAEPPLRPVSRGRPTRAGCQPAWIRR